MIRNLHLKNSRTCALIVILGFALTSFGCKKKEQPPVVPPPAKVATPQQVKPVQKQLSSALKLPSQPVNQFDFSNKKDPFKPFIVIKPVVRDEKKRLKESLPIHNLDVSQFRLIGVVTGDKENKAMVVDPQGKGYVLKIGMTIGKNDGRITAITNNGVTVVEQFRDDNGRVRKETITITLPRKQ